MPDCDDRGLECGEVFDDGGPEYWEVYDDRAPECWEVYVKGKSALKANHS
jgi:hypothetical protein